jgi:hypothetical protein
MTKMRNRSPFQHISQLANASFLTILPSPSFLLAAGTYLSKENPAISFPSDLIVVPSRTWEGERA